MLKRFLLLMSLCVVFALTSIPVLAQDAEATETAAETVVEAAPAAANTSGMVIGVWHLHSAVRWIVVVVTVLLLIKLLMGVFGGGSYDKLTQTLTRLFTISISVQWLIGIVLLVVMGQFDVRWRWEHAAVMTVAVAVASASARWKNAPDAQRYRMTLLMVIITLVLVYVGVALLPQGWRAMPITG